MVESFVPDWFCSEDNDGDETLEDALLLGTEDSGKEEEETEGGDKGANGCEGKLSEVEGDSKLRAEEEEEDRQTGNLDRSCFSISDKMKVEEEEEGEEEEQEEEGNGIKGNTGSGKELEEEEEECENFSEDEKQ